MYMLYTLDWLRALAIESYSWKEKKRGSSRAPFCFLSAFRSDSLISPLNYKYVIYKIRKKKGVPWPYRERKKCQTNVEIYRNDVSLFSSFSFRRVCRVFISLFALRGENWNNKKYIKRVYKMLKVRKTQKQEKAYIIPSASGSHVFPFFFFLRRFIRKLKPDVPLQHNRFFHLDIEVYGGGRAICVRVYTYFPSIIITPITSSSSTQLFSKCKMHRALVYYYIALFIFDAIIC